MFDWDDANVDHLARHDVTPEEAEGALSDPSRIGAPAYAVEGERRRALIGATEDGRVLFVVFARRGQGVRVVTARNATPSEKRRYRR
jgi:uncharacterized DUF497 family protein